MANKIGIEDNFKKLDDIVKELENSEISLEESFNLYKDGIKLIKECNDSIDKVEKELIILNEIGENNES